MSQTETVTVANPKTFALTQNKTYNVIGRDGRKITIVNDNNITSTYYASLFKETAEEEQAKKEPEIVLPTVQEIIDTVVYNMTNNNITIAIQGTNHTLNINLGNSGTSISCGVRQIYRLEEMFDYLNEFFEENFPHFPSGLVTDIINSIFVKSINSIMENTTSVPLFLASTNTNSANFERIDAILNVIAGTSYTCLNNNSGNEIKVWLLEQQFEDN